MLSRKQTEEVKELLTDEYFDEAVANMAEFLDHSLSFSLESDEDQEDFEQTIRIQLKSYLIRKS